MVERMMGGRKKAGGMLPSRPVTGGDRQQAVDVSVVLSENCRTALSCFCVTCS